MSKTTINIDTNIDETLKKVEELIVKCEELGDKGKQLYFLTTKDIAEAMRLFHSGCTANFSITRFPIN